MSPRSVTSPQLGVGWALAVLFAVSSFGGVPCGTDSEDKAAMECCRGDMHECNMPDKTEDCCRPDRTDENPAVLKAAPDEGAVHAGLVLVLETELTPRLFHPVVPKLARISHARGFPDCATNRPLTIALLI